MNERFTRLFTLPESLYIKDAPVIISAGALLKDNQSGKTLAQLKFETITENVIKALTVSLIPFDTTGQRLGEAIEYQYLDLTAARGDEFGQKTPIPLPDHATRSFDVSVKEVIFADNNIWHGSTASWEPLPAPVEISDSISDHALVYQYSLDNGKDALYLPDEISDLWYCTCGTLNHSDETECARCRRILSEQKIAVSKDVLQAHCDEREAKEAEAKEKAIARTKKTIKIAIPIVAILVVLAVIVKFGVPWWKYHNVEKMIENGHIAEAAIYLGNRTDDKDAQAKSFELWSQVAERDTIAGGSYFFMGLKTDGTVATAIVASCTNDYGQRNVSDWTDIVAIVTGANHTVGLKTNGSVVAIGHNKHGQCDVGNWSDVVAISAGYYHTVGIKVDGSVVAVGNNNYGQCDVSDWSDIVAVSAGANHTVGLKVNGSVVATGYNDYGQCDVSDWKDIVAIATGSNHTVGLKADGSVIATGDNDYGQCDVSNWSNIVAIFTGKNGSIGLKMDGTIESVLESKYEQKILNNWQNIVTITEGKYGYIGLKTNGIVVQSLGVGYMGMSGIKIPENRR